MFFFEADRLLAQNPDETLENQFRKAMYEYKNNDFKKAAARLARLKAAYENMNKPASLGNESDEIKCRQGQVLLLLGVCCEKLNNKDDARMNYMLAKELLDKDFFIKDLKLKGLPVYKEIKRKKSKPERKSDI
jgi:Flp pilus assembly protein TadD